MTNEDKDFDEVYPYKQGIALVKKGAHFGAIMVGGKQILPPIYESLTDFENGYATAKYYGEERVINLSGQVQVRNDDEQFFLPEEYDWGWDFEDGRCVVIRDGKLGAIDKDLNIILPFEYELIQMLSHKFFLCEIDGTVLECVINKSGHIVIKLVHNEYVTVIGSYFVCDSSYWGSSRIVDFHGKILLDSNSDGYFHEAQQVNENYFFTKLILHDKKGTVSYLLNKNGDVVFEVRDNLQIMSDSTNIYCKTSYGSLYKIVNDGDIYLLYTNCDIKKLSPDTDLVKLSKLKGTKVSAQYLNYRFRELSNDLLSVYDNRTNLYGLAEKDGTIILSPQYNSIGICTDKSYIVSISKKDAQNNTRKIKFGIVNNAGTEILPFEYDSLDVLIPHKLLRYSLRNENSYTKLYGLIDSNYNVICSPIYNKFETMNTSDMVKAIIGNLCGIIDVKGNIIIPAKFGSISRSQNTEAPFLVSVSQATLYGSMGKTNLANEKGEFVVQTKDGSNIYISSSRFDWCGNYSASGIAEVMLNGMTGKIDLSGHLITINDNKILRTPDIFSWAYDFKYGYAAVQKDSKWGIVNDKFEIVIPCEYDYITPLYPGYFTYKKEDSQKCGLLDVSNNVIAPNEYASIENVDDKYFKLEVYNQHGNPKSGKFLLIDMKGKSLIPIPCSQFELLNIDERQYWLINSGGWGVYFDEQLLISTIYSKIVYENGHFLCTLISQHRDYDIYQTVFDEYKFVINLKGEIILNCLGRDYAVPSEYDLAFDAGPGLIKVKRKGKWGLLNFKKELVADTQYAYISDYKGIYAIIGVGDAYSHVCHRSDERSLSDKMLFGLIDTNGEEVLTPDNEVLIIFDNGYICYRSDGQYGLMSPALNAIFPPQFHSIKMIDNCHFVVNDDTGLIDINGNIIIPPHKRRSIYDSPYTIELLTDGFYKIIKKHDNYCEYSIVNSCGKTILPFEPNIEDLKMLDNGLILATIRYYNHSDYNFNIITLQGNKLFQINYAEMKFMEDGLISIRGKDGWGVADILGNIIFEPKYINEFEFNDSFSDIQVRGSSYTLECDIDGRIYVKNGEGRIALPDDYYWGTDFINGISIVRRKNSYRGMGVIDTNNSIIVPANYESIKLFSNNIIITMRDGILGAYDLNGNMILPPIFLSIEFVSENIIWVKWNLNLGTSWNNKGYIKDDGDSVDANYNQTDSTNLAIYKSALCSLDGHIVNDSELAYIGKFFGKYAIACKEFIIENGNAKPKQFGVVDIDGNTIIDPIYDIVLLCKEVSFAKVMVDKKYGIADLANRKVTMMDGVDVRHIWEIDKYGRCLYSDIACKYNRRSKRCYGGNKGVYYKNRIIIPPGKYDDVALLRNGLIQVSQKRADQYFYGLLDLNGKELLPMNYSSISPFEGDYASLCLDGKWGVVNSKGIITQECVNDSKIKIGIPIMNNNESGKTSLPTPTILISEVFPEDNYGNDYCNSYYDDEYYGNYYDDGYSQDELNDMYREAFDGNPEYESNID